MRVGQRLFLAVLPAVFGLLSVAALAYWGQYARQAPNAVVSLAIAASILSLVMAWTNTRYVARRLERLAPPLGLPTSRLGLARAAISGAFRGREASPARPDEIDTIERAKRRVEYDMYYIENWSFLLDLRIILETVWRLIWDRNAY